ncbi:S-layer homology domain-containing protein [Cohnella suwonensis]|uniref:S-layer homology domain-containing protein n=1 Tax=Cohnella suwonensis TaxID=696072 RepID=A0ABW0M3H7_9BACL
MASNTINKVFVLMLSLMLALSSFGYASAQAPAPDTKGHWAEKEINDWVSQGLIQGFSDGSFKPDQSITRGEFMVLVNRAFGFTELADVAFKDLKTKAWVYQDIRKAVKAGYVNGYSDGTIRYSRTINRQESAVVVANLLRLPANPGAANVFSDAGKIASWGKGAVGALTTEQVWKNIADVSFEPSKDLTRAEAVVVLDRATRLAETAYKAAGIYGPASGTQTIKGNVSVTVGGVKLQNLVIEGNLLLAESIGEGDVFLDNVTVKGKTFVNGGGKNSVHFNNSVLVTVVVNKKSGEIRVVVEGATTVKQITLQSGAKLESNATAVGGIDSVELSSEMPKDSKVTLMGRFDNVDISAASIAIDIPQGSVDQFTASDSAAGVTLNLGKDAKVVDLVLEAVVKVLGQGTIDNADVKDSAKGSTFEKPPTKTEGSGAPTTNSGSSGGGGGSGGTPNAAPTVASMISDQTGVAGGTAVSVDASATFADADHDALTLTAASSDESKATVTVTGTTITVTPVAAGTATITVTANDGHGHMISDSFDIVVGTAPNAAPTVASPIADQEGVAGGAEVTLEANTTFEDVDGDTLTFSAASSDESIATVAVAGSDITVTPVAAGTATITVTVNDGHGNMISDSFDIVVGTAPNAAPTVASPIADQEGVAGGAEVTLEANTTFEDVDGDTLTFSAASSDESIATVAVAGSDITVTPVAAGTATITVTVNDGHSHTVSDSFDIVVKAQSTALISANVITVNFAASDVRKDMVNVIDGPIGSLVTVYDEGGLVLGTATPDADGDSIVTVEDGFDSSWNSIYATITEVGKAESEKVAQSINWSNPVAPAADDVSIFNNPGTMDDEITIENVPDNSIVTLYDQDGEPFEGIYFFVTNGNRVSFIFKGGINASVTDFSVQIMTGIDDVAFAVSQLSGQIGIPVEANSGQTDILYFGVTDVDPDQLHVNIDLATHEIEVVVPVGYDLAHVVRSFILSAGATAKIGTADQESEVTENDFSSPVTYVVTAGDGTTQTTWQVSIAEIT